MSAEMKPSTAEPEAVHGFTQHQDNKVDWLGLRLCRPSKMHVFLAAHKKASPGTKGRTLAYLGLRVDKYLKIGNMTGSRM